jgi:TIR domain
MAGQPAAFMSYARFDDQHEDGQLTAFRERLAAEVRMQTGEEFHIFQDRTDIAWGQNWQQRINQTLDTVTLLLVIITPGFFRSPHCRAETVEESALSARRLAARPSMRPAHRPRVWALRAAFPSRSPMLPARTCSLRAVSVFLTSTLKEERLRSGTDKGRPIRKRTGKTWNPAPEKYGAPESPQFETLTREPDCVDLACRSPVPAPTSRLPVPPGMRTGRALLGDVEVPGAGWP